MTDELTLEKYEEVADVSFDLSEEEFDRAAINNELKALFNS